MSFAATSAAAAAAAKKRIECEEEEMTSYYPEELANDWEFKIVRSATNSFGNPNTLQKLLEREALFGWVMVEKFDNARVRFKRPASAKAKDTELPEGKNPYDTNFGISEGMLALLIVAGIFILMGCGALGLFLVSYLAFG